MIKVISIATGIILLGLCLVAFTILLWFLTSRLADFICWCFLRKNQLNKIDTDRNWWYELLEDHLCVSKQIIRWHYRWYMNIDGMYSISKSGDILACREALHECLELVHQLYTLENEVCWRRYHCGENDLGSTEDWIKTLRRERIKLEFCLKDLKEKEALILARMAEDAEKNPPAGEEDEDFILR